MQFAILTGDIVASTDLNQAELTQTMTRLEQAAHDIAQTWDGSPRTGFARRGGDSWQLAIAAPHYAFRATLYCQALIRCLGDDRATRIAVAEGDGTLPPDGDANAGHGPVFIASGRALETMGRHSFINHAEGGAKTALFRLADTITKGWTTPQAEALVEMLPPGKRTQAEIAHKLGKKHASSVQQLLAAAEYRAIQDAIRAIEGPQ